MNNKSVLIYERNCFMAEPIFLGVFEDINSAKEILKEANESYNYFKQLPEKSEKYQKGEFVLDIFYFDVKFIKGQKILINCSFTMGSLAINSVSLNETNIKKMQRRGMELLLPREVL